MRPVFQADDNCALRRQRRYLQPVRDQRIALSTALNSYSMLKNSILAVDLDRGARLEEQVGTSGEHKIRCHIPCLYHAPLKQRRVAMHSHSIDLCLPAGHNEPYVRGGSSRTDKTAAGEQRDCRL